MSTKVSARDCPGAPAGIEPGDAAVTLKELRVRPGLRLTKGQVVAVLEWQDGDDNRREARLRAPEAGKVDKVAVKTKSRVDLE